MAALRSDELDYPSATEKELAEPLTLFIEEYEERSFPIRKATPRQTLIHLMEARGLQQKDLSKLIGSKGITPEVVHGKRAISKTPAKKLGAFFHVDAALFI